MCSNAHRQVDDQLSERSTKNDHKSAVPTLSVSCMIERGNPSSTVTIVTSQNTDLFSADHQIHDNWVASFRTWNRRSQSHGKAWTCRNQSNVWDSRRLLHVKPKFETKFLRSVTFVQVNLMSVAPTLQNLKSGLKRRQSGKSKVPAKQRWSWPRVCLHLKEKNRATFFSPSKKRCLPVSTLELGTKFCRLQSVIAHDQQKRLDWCWNGYFDEIVQSLHSHYRQWRSADAWRGCSVCQRIGYILDTESPRKHASSIVAWTACRWKWIFSCKDQWFRIQCDTENFVPIVVPGLSTSSSSRLEKARIEQKVIPLKCLWLVPMLMIEQGNPLWPMPTKKTTKTNFEETKIERGDTLYADFWNPRVAARIEGNFGEWWGPWTQGLTRQFFLGSIVRAHIHETWGFG